MTRGAVNPNMGSQKDIEDSESAHGGVQPAARRGGAFPRAARIPQRTYTTGMTVAIAGILTFFIALVSAYIVRQGSVAEDWRSLSIPKVLWLNTAILVGSSFTLARSRRHFLTADESGFRHWWTVTAILGLFFIVGQMIAWRQLSAIGIGLLTNPSSSFFYLLTAAHGLYFFGGVIALVMVGFRPTRYVAHATSIGVISIYWNFMVGLWTCLFLLFLFRQ